MCQHRECSLIWSYRLTLSPCNDNSSLKEAFSEVYYIQAACLVIGGYLDGRLRSDLVLTVIKIYFASYLTTLDASRGLLLKYSTHWSTSTGSFIYYRSAPFIANPIQNLGQIRSILNHTSNGLLL
jgi:hypothetical protein